MKSRALLIWQSVLGGLQVIAASAEATDSLPPAVAAYWPTFVIIVGAMQVATATFVHGLHTLPASTPVVMVERGADVSIATSATPASTSTAAAERRNYP